MNSNSTRSKLGPLDENYEENKGKWWEIDKSRSLDVKVKVLDVPDV